MKEYINDMIVFYRKHGRFIAKAMLAMYGIYAVALLVVKYHQEIRYRLFQTVAWVEGKIYPLKEVDVSGGLDPEETEDAK